MKRPTLRVDLLAGAAFRAGWGDYVHLLGPAPQQLEREGFGRVVASVGEAMPPVAFSSLAASRRLVVRYDRSLTIYGAFFHIACFMIVLRRVLNPHSPCSAFS